MIRKWRKKGRYRRRDRRRQGEMGAKMMTNTRRGDEVEDRAEGRRIAKQLWESTGMKERGNPGRGMGPGCVRLLRFT